MGLSPAPPIYSSDSEPTYYDSGDLNGAEVMNAISCTPIDSGTVAIRGYCEFDPGSTSPPPPRFSSFLFVMLSLSPMANLDVRMQGTTG